METKHIEEKNYIFFTTGLEGKKKVVKKNNEK